MADLILLILAYLCGLATIPAIILAVGIAGALDRLFGDSQ